MMKKSPVRWWIVLAAVLVVYNVIVFAIPFPKTPVFFVSWLFTLVAIAAQAYVIHTAFGGEGTRSKFYGFPIARIGVMYLGAQLVLGLAFMALGAAVSLWIPLVLYVVLLGAAAVGFVATDAARDEVVRQDAKLVKDVSRMRAMQSKVAPMIGRVKGVEAAAALKNFAEDLRFSDPVSSGDLQDVEADLAACIDDLQAAVAAGDDVRTLALCRKAGGILAERNRLCRLNKSSVQ